MEQKQFVSKHEELVEGKAGRRRDFRNKRRELINAVGDLLVSINSSKKTLRDFASATRFESLVVCRRRSLKNSVNGMSALGQLGHCSFDRLVDLASLAAP